MSFAAALGARPTAGSTAYVLVVGTLAAVGFIGQTTWPILLAALLALPASLVAVPGYYLAYGLLALLPGANASSSSGSGTGAADGTTASFTSSGASWFATTTQVIGILALVGAAILNVLLVRALSRRRRTDPAPLGPS
jgi:hypothetical protein